MSALGERSRPFLYPRNRAEPYFSGRQNRADLFPVAATVRPSLSIWQSGEVITKQLSEPDQKAQSPSGGTPSELPRFLSTQIFK
jgi:hypothetical protein